MAQPTIHKLNNLQKDLYQNTVLQISRDPAVASPHIIAYSEKFYESLPESFAYTDVKKIYNDMDSSRLLLYGDFHTFGQSQKSLIRLISNYLSASSNRKVIFALEMFEAEKQEYIDKYLRSEIDEATLLEKCKYDENWGFPWENYRLIVSYAKKHSIPIKGINLPKSLESSLEYRDKFTADILEKTIDLEDQALVVCMIGEYHLADQHLPTKLRNDIVFTRILTNIEHYYFLASSESFDSSTDYLELKPRLYCILNSTPWIKWQSYAIWEEMQAAAGMVNQSSGHFYTEDHFDIDYQILHLMSHLKEFLNIKLAKTDLCRFQVRLQPKKEELQRIASFYCIDEQRLQTISYRVKIDGYHVISDKNLIIIEDISLNSFAEIAGQLLFSLTNEAPSKESNYYYQVLMIASGFFCSKVLNPRRHCPNIPETTLQHPNFDREKKIINKQIKSLINSINKEKNTAISQLLMRFDNSYSLRFATELGQLIGHQCYRAIIEKNDQTLEKKDYFFFNPDKTSIPLKYKLIMLHLFNDKA